MYLVLDSNSSSNHEKTSSVFIEIPKVDLSDLCAKNKETPPFPGCKLIAACQGAKVWAYPLDDGTFYYFYTE